MTTTTPPSSRFAEALTLAATLHQSQFRKGTTIPYVSHLLAVAALVLENHGSEDEAIAALLHDAVEDCGGAPVLMRIRDTFGDHVADIVNGCTDAYVDPKPEWRKRKLDYLERLGHARASERLVSAADKVHNARAILSDLREHGGGVWDRFKTGKDGTLWYYRALSDIYAKKGPAPLARELDRAVTAIETEFNGGLSVTDAPARSAR
jgi:(p)ppGpp synthase/HD superfamily hydrolase